nr:MAG TPA: hypothetical protein [Caudoviricetes sp.]
MFKPCVDVFRTPRRAFYTGLRTGLRELIGLYRWFLTIFVRQRKSAHLTKYR